MELLDVFSDVETPVTSDTEDEPVNTLTGCLIYKRILCHDAQHNDTQHNNKKSLHSA
jgi:hypothetical protein